MTRQMPPLSERKRMNCPEPPRKIKLPSGAENRPGIRFLTDTRAAYHIHSLKTVYSFGSDVSGSGGNGTPPSMVPSASASVIKASK